MNQHHIYSIALIISIFVLMYGLFSQQLVYVIGGLLFVLINTGVLIVLKKPDLENEEKAKWWRALLEIFNQVP